MAEQHADETILRDGTAMKRRGLLAGAAALVAGIAAKQMSEPVAASSAMQIATAEAGGVLNGPAIGPSFLYDTNAGYTSSESMITVSNSNGPALASLRGTTFGVNPFTTTGPLPPEKCGVYGDTASQVGVLGAASLGGTGVKGLILPGSTATDTVAIDGANASTGVRGIGVRGVCNAGFGVGVQGQSSTYYGVQGITDNGVAVLGDVKAGAARTSNIGVLGRVGVLAPNAQSNTTAVYGQNTATGSGGIGVQGTSTKGTGVVGTGPYGVVGNTSSVGGYGGFFTTIANQSTAVGGQVFGTTSGAAAFVGAAAAGNYAAFFTGTVIVNGAFFVSGGAKSAAVKHPRTNDYRALYCLESPESWFEDFGEGKLAGGKAEVKLDPDFAVLIHPDSYHVFLTPRDAGCKGLAVTAQRGDAFTVQELNSGSSTGTFSYRVVGKRSDIKLDRLAKVAMPQIKLASEPPKVPDEPAAPPDPPPPPAVPPSRPAAPAGGVQGSGGTQSNPTNPVQPIPPPRP